MSMSSLRRVRPVTACIALLSFALQSTQDLDSISPFQTRDVPHLGHLCLRGGMQADTEDDSSHSSQMLSADATNMEPTWTMSNGAVMGGNADDLCETGDATSLSSTARNMRSFLRLRAKT